MEGGSITAAVILAAIISIITLIVGRGSRISELRQAWINDQRGDFSKWAAAALALARKQSPSSRTVDFNALEEAAFRIRLRENPRKKEWKPVIEKMDAVRMKLLSADGCAQVEIFDDLVAIAELTQIRLKRDWNRVRFGELGYRLLIFFFPMLFAALFLIGYYALFPDQNPFAANTESRGAIGSSQLIEAPAGETNRIPVATEQRSGKSTRQDGS